MTRRPITQNLTISNSPFPTHTPPHARRLNLYLLQVLVSERLNHIPLLGWILRILEFPDLGDCYQVMTGQSRRRWPR